MSRIIVIEFVTLDGVIHDPDGAEGSTHGGWAFRHGQRRWPGTSSASARCSTPAPCCSGAGRGRSSPASGRPARTSSPAKMNAIPKLVASRTLDDVGAWSNSTLLRRRSPRGGAGAQGRARPRRGRQRERRARPDGAPTWSTSTGCWSSRPSSARAPACSSPATRAPTSASRRRRPPARPRCSSTVGPPDALRRADLREAWRLRPVQRRGAPGGVGRVPGARP